MNLLLTYSSASFDTFIDGLLLDLSRKHFDVKKLQISVNEKSSRNFLGEFDNSDLIIFFSDKDDKLELGFLLAFCIETAKPTIFICETENIKKLKNISANNEEFYYIEKSSQNIKEQIFKILNSKSIDKPIRFNFFLSPQLSHYLDWISKHKKISRSVYLRQLLDKAAK